jgi:hypothetical protein
VTDRSFYLVISVSSATGRRRDCMDLQLTVQLVSITAKVVSFNPTHGEVYLIQHCVIKFVSDLQQIDGFLWVQFPPPIKLTYKIYTVADL